jgi:ribosome-associated translation inhibitor RaiA
MSSNTNKELYFMPILVSAHGFELTEAIRNACVEECEDRILPVARHNFGARWTLHLEHLTHSAHIAWNDGQFSGDATVKSEDMYTSIHQAAKKALEQIKKAHEKRYDHHKHQKLKVVGEE